jgi:hypothetical protein
MNALTFFQALYPELKDGERIELRTVKPTVKCWWVSKIEDIEPEIVKVPHNLYFGVNPRKGNTSTNEDVSRIVAVIADIDLKSCKDPMGALESYGLTPSAIVSSGGGVHVYWFLEDRDPDTPDFATARQEFLRLGPSDAVHDAARILRVPGTKNTKYETPRPVEVAVVNNNIRYPRSVFAKMTKIDPDLRRRIYTGDKEGYESRSERDWDILISMIAAGMSDAEIVTLIRLCPFGDRFRERGATLVERELVRAREKAPKIRQAQDGGFYVEDNCLWVAKDKGARKVATFVFEPEALLEGDSSNEDTLMGSIIAEGTTHKWEHVQLPRSAFSDRRSLTRKLPVAAWSWLGNDNDVVHYLPYLMRRIQEKGVPRLHAVKSLGRHGTVWVTNHSVITQTTETTFSEAGFAYLDRYQEKPKVAYKLQEARECAPLLQKVVSLAADINEPHVVWTIFDWILASMYKPLIGPSGREFPFLNVVGTQGSGKTSTLKDVFLPMVGYDPPMSYSCDTTDFVTMALMASSTSIPVFFAEYRSTLANIERFLRRVRLSYDTGFDARGKADQTTVSYELCCPIIIDGENSIDEAALRERSVVVTMHPESLTEDRRVKFNELIALPIKDLAGFFVQWTLRHEPPLAKADKYVSQMLRKQIPDRVRRNLVKLCCGHEVLGEMCTGANVKLVRPPFEEIVQPWLDTILLGDTCRTSVLVDELVEDVVNEVAKTQIGYALGKTQKIASGVSPFTWKYDNRVDTLSFHLASTLGWWIQYRNQRKMATMSSAVAKTQLRERYADIPVKGQYISKIGTQAGPSGPVHMYSIHLPSAHSSGLDIPQTLRLIAVQGGAE